MLSTIGTPGVVPERQRPFPTGANEPDRAAFAKRTVPFRDGLIENDEKQRQEAICSR